MNGSSILIGVVGTWVHTFVKTHQIIFKKLIHLYSQNPCSSLQINFTAYKKKRKENNGLVMENGFEEVLSGFSENSQEALQEGGRWLCLGLQGQWS